MPPLGSPLIGNSPEVNKAVRKANWELRKNLSDPKRAVPKANPTRTKVSAFLPAISPYVKDGTFDLEYFRNATVGLHPNCEPQIAPRPVKLEYLHTPRIYFWFDSPKAFLDFCNFTSWPLRRVEDPKEGITGVWHPEFL